MSSRMLRMDLLKKPAFWAAHMWNVTRGPLVTGDPNFTNASFRVSIEEIETFYLGELSNKVQCPYFRIALPFGYCVEVEYANEPDDYEVVYFICQQESPKQIHIGNGGGHWRLPALRWAELLAISTASGHSEPALLLLFPAVWITDDDDSTEIRDHLFDACKALDFVLENQIDVFVNQLIASSKCQIQWQKHDSHEWITNGKNSRRNPESGVSMNSEESLALNVFFKHLNFHTPLFGPGN